MRILADVNIEAAMIAWLLDQGHDVLSARVEYSSAADTDLLGLALRTDRVIFTRDKDFGDLVFRDRMRTAGVILVRLKARNQTERLELFKPLWPAIESAAPGSMIVVANDRLRIKPLR